MRRNLRLDWRALALLGALLTIMIKWPGEAGGKGLVHAMPTNLPTETSIIKLLQMDRNVSVNDQYNEPILQSTTSEYKYADTTTTTTTSTHTDNEEEMQTEKNILYEYVTTGYKKSNNYNEVGYNKTADHSSVQNNSTTIPTDDDDNKKLSKLIMENKGYNQENINAAQQENSQSIRNNDNINYNNNNNHYINNKQLTDKFIFTSTHHIAAILSRTERSAVDDMSSSIVKRSPDITHGSNLVGGLKSRRLNNSRNNNNNNNNNSNINYNNNGYGNSLDRNERSTISHLSGPSRKIQLFIKNRYLQLLPDGTVNGTQDDLSEYTILQRSTVDVGRIKIQSVATCLYLCMDACGAVFGSIDFTDDCIFNENMEQHNYNTYSSTYNSNSKRTYYLALNRHGEPRKLQIPPTRSLGKLATYTNAITETVPQERVEQLIAKNFGENRVKHGIRQLCDIGKPLIELIDRHNFKARPMCNPNSSSNNHNNSSNSGLNGHSQTSSSTFKNSQLNKNPAANDKIKTNIDINTNSKMNSNDDNMNHQMHHENYDSNRNDNQKINASSYSKLSWSQEDENSSISRNQSLSGHISNSTMISSSGLANQQQSDNVPKKKKRRKCRPYEDEERHNCHRGPQALRKRNQQNGNNNKNRNKLPKCKDVTFVNGEPTTPCHTSKRNGQQHNKKQKHQKHAGEQNSGLKRVKKGRWNGNGQHKKNKLKKKHNQKRVGKSRQQDQTVISSTTLRNGEQTTSKLWPTTIFAGLESTTVYNGGEAERFDTTTSNDRAAFVDRVEREQRNVPAANAMDATADSVEDNEESASEEASTEDDKNANDHEDDDDVESSSYEELHAHFTGGSDDNLYYDQLNL